MINNNLLLSEFTDDDQMPIYGENGYVEGDEIAITFETYSSVSGEIIIGFTLDAVKKAHMDLEDHEYTSSYDIVLTAHRLISSCNCGWIETEEYEDHEDNNEDSVCDTCDYIIEKEECLYEWIPYEEGHVMNMLCDCCDAIDVVYSHENKDGDLKCDVCGYLFKQEGFIYEKERDSYSIVGFLGDDDGIVEIPDYYNGLPVRYIRGNAFYRQESIIEVIIGSNVLCIEGNAFMHCYNLEKVTLGENVELIDRQVFLGCSELEEIVIPVSVTFIGSGVFYLCDKLKSVILEDPNGWCNSSRGYNKPFPIEDMSSGETVAKYFTDTYRSDAWRKNKLL